MTMSNDFLHRFQLERAGVRGALVRLDESWQRIRTNGDYSGPLADLLGQTLAASALFTSSIKFEGRLSIHLRDSGPLRLLFADCTHEGELRGIARWQGAAPQAPIELEADARLAITIENAVTDTRYQGLVSRAPSSRTRSRAISRAPSSCRRASCWPRPAVAAAA